MHTPQRNDRAPQQHSPQQDSGQHCQQHSRRPLFTIDAASRTVAVYAASRTVAATASSLAVLAAAAADWIPVEPAAVYVFFAAATVFLADCIQSRRR
ncbi:hypothetical protein [Streptomyces sp. NPDC002580]|uniref:hypothetical protein n=1 Tax=Streptomyces sp. NPDC002580 TaxID=3364653 RepID=UPI0036919AA0